jgi:hypothetical protein
LLKVTPRHSKIAKVAMEILGGAQVKMRVSCCLDILKGDVDVYLLIFDEVGEVFLVHLISGLG